MCTLGRGQDGLSGLRVLAAVAHATRACCGGSLRARLGLVCGAVWLAGTLWRMRRCRAQMFNSASAFNQNLAGWNVLRVTTLTSAFDSTTALANCYKKDMYTAWGTTLQAAYPVWSSLALCTPRCAR
jgi:hypothetical protein